MINAIFAIIIGALTAIIYFGSLWLTIQQLINSRCTAARLISVRLARLVLFAAIFYVLIRQDLNTMLVALIGFWSVRWLFTWQIGVANDR